MKPLIGYGSGVSASRRHDLLAIHSRGRNALIGEVFLAELLLDTRPPEATLLAPASVSVKSLGKLPRPDLGPSGRSFRKWGLPTGTAHFLTNGDYTSKRTWRLGHSNAIIWNRQQGEPNANRIAPIADRYLRFVALLISPRILSSIQSAISAAICVLFFSSIIMWPLPWIPFEARGTKSLATPARVRKREVQWS